MEVIKLRRLENGKKKSKPNYKGSFLTHGNLCQQIRLLHCYIQIRENKLQLVPKLFR